MIMVDSYLRTLTRLGCLPLIGFGALFAISRCNGNREAEPPAVVKPQEKEPVKDKVQKN